MIYTMLTVRGNISSTFSSNSEAFASELLENIEKMYYMHRDNLLPHADVLPVAKGVKSVSSTNITP